MTEEIIVDGVNVANCGYFYETDKECSICGMGTDGEDTFCRDCKDNPNCYYKQLKRLEQENNAYKQSEQEAIEIIKELKEYSQRMENQRENYYKEYKKYRSALEEIKHILEIHKDELEECLHNDIDGMIQDKINEVLK